MTIRILYDGPTIDIPMRDGHRPRDISWNSRLDEPDVIQMSLFEDIRITWNPDDGRFYVEQRSTQDEWETIATRVGSVHGWDNAKYFGLHASLH